MAFDAYPYHSFLVEVQTKLATYLRSMRNSNLEIRIAAPLVARSTPIPEKTRSCMEVRLTSPRGKFKITNMSDDQVDPTPEDIPGSCTSSSGFARSINCLCCLFSTKSLHSG